MDRYITVTGKGRVLVSPDFIRISMRLESEAKEYGAAMEKASEKIGSLTSALGRAGFKEEDVKTSDFSVDTVNEWKKALGKEKKVQAGFRVSQRVKLGFDLDLERLARTLGVISKWSKAEPDLSVAFTVKDPAAVLDAVLESAAVNARRQAEALCAASGAKLGTLAEIKYSRTEIDLRSTTRYATYRDSKMVTRDIGAVSYSLSTPAVAKIRPDEIDARDSATFVWAIEDKD